MSTAREYTVDILISSKPCPDQKIRRNVFINTAERATRRSPKMLHAKVFNHFEKSSSLLLDENNRIAAKNATISATINKKPARR